MSFTAAEPALHSPSGITDRQVGVFYAYPEQWDGDALAVAYASLDAHERERSGRFVYEHDRKLYVVAHALLRHGLSLASPGTAPGAWRFSTAGKFGKPQLAKPGGPLRFSLSHTQGLAACSVAYGREVGIDVEPRDRKPPVASGILSASELLLLRGLAAEAKGEAFFRRWTLKEAYAKALGLGLSMPFDRFSFVFCAQGVRCRDEAQERDVSDHRFRSWVLERHCVGLAFAVSPACALEVVERRVGPY
jgi:4'-phosphopantetheinyl transferase